MRVHSPEIELAWAAGFFDGEGSTFLVSGKRKKKLLVVAITQVHPEVLHRFVAAVGKGNVRGPYQPPNPRAQGFYKVKYTGWVARDVLMEMWPYLSSVKRKQAKDRFKIWRSQYA